MTKINKKRIKTSILDRFQNDEVFHASQLQHNWTEEWCEYLDYVRTIDITHNHQKFLEKGPMRSRPDYHETTRAIVSMSKEASQNPQIISRRNKCCDDLDSEKLEWLIWLSHNWKWYFAVNRHSDLNSTQRHYRESEEEQASGNREAFTHDDRWKANWWNHVLVGIGISHPRSGNYCVCDGCVHTLRVARTFC